MGNEGPNTESPALAFWFLIESELTARKLTASLLKYLNFLRQYYTPMGVSTFFSGPNTAGESLVIPRHPW